MNRLITLIAGIAVSLLCSFPVALACGDKLAAIGGGLRFDLMHRTEHPGSLLVYLSPHSQFKAANDDLQLVSWLERAGNKVVVVDTPAALSDAMTGKGHADLLLLDAADARELMGKNLSGTGMGPMLPVLYHPSDDELAVARSLGPCYAQAGKRKQWQFVRLVDQVISQRRSGKAGDCAGR